MTKRELENRVSDLEGENESLEEALANRNMEIAQLEGHIEDMETELGYGLYALPVFPDLIHRDDPVEYIKQFNQLRHLKELPQ